MAEFLPARPGGRSPAPRTYSQLTFDGDELVLGARTKLASINRAGAAPIDEARLEALLAVAYGRPIARSSLAHARRAIEKMRDGETVTALMHLALTGLGKLAGPDEAAFRLSAADDLIGSGVGARMILHSLALDDRSIVGNLNKYDPDQPRVPAGSGPASGQWTRGSSTADDNNTAGSVSGSETRDKAQCLAILQRACHPNAGFWRCLFPLCPALYGGTRLAGVAKALRKQLVTRKPSWAQASLRLSDASMGRNHDL